MKSKLVVEVVVKVGVKLLFQTWAKPKEYLTQLSYSWSWSWAWQNDSHPSKNLFLTSEFPFNVQVWIFKKEIQVRNPCCWDQTSSSTSADDCFLVTGVGQELKLLLTYSGMSLARPHLEEHLMALKSTVLKFRPWWAIFFPSEGCPQLNFFF